MNILEKSIPVGLSIDEISTKLNDKSNLDKFDLDVSDEMLIF